MTLQYDAGRLSNLKNQSCAALPNRVAITEDEGISGNAFPDQWRSQELSCNLLLAVHQSELHTVEDLPAFQMSR